MDNHDQKALTERKQERDKLFGIKGDDILKLSIPDQYQRMRYQREIEGYEYIRLYRSGYNQKDACNLCLKKGDEIVENWNTDCSLCEMYRDLR